MKLQTNFARFGVEADMEWKLPFVPECRARTVTSPEKPGVQGREK